MQQHRTGDTEAAKRLSDFSSALLKAYQEYTNRLQKDRDAGLSALDESHFHQYLSTVCGLVAEHVEAESCSVMLRGTADRPEYPKGYLTLVACNSTSVWSRIIPEKPEFNLAVRKSPTKTIYQSRSVQIHDFETIRNDRLTEIGYYDVPVWTGEDLQHCFRNYIGMPIRIQPQADPVGVLRVENKHLTAKIEWKHPECEFRPGMTKEQLVEALDRRNDELAKVRPSLGWWSNDDASLLAIAASYIAKVEELRLTMHAAQLSPSVPLDSSDFAYLHVCSDRFARSVSECLRDAEQSKQALDFHVNQVLAAVRRGGQGDELFMRELDAVDYTSRIKGVRNLFERLSSQSRAWHMARRVVMAAECCAALDRDPDRLSNDWREKLTAVLQWLQERNTKALARLRDDILDVASSVDPDDGLVWRDADFTAAPLKVTREQKQVIAVTRTLLTSMKIHLAGTKPQTPGEITFADCLAGYELDQAAPTVLRSHMLPLSRVLLGYYARRTRRQGSYLVQLYGLTQNTRWRRFYGKRWRLVDRLSRAFQEERATMGKRDATLFDSMFESLDGMFQHDTLNEMKERFGPEKGERKGQDAYSLVGSYAAIYKRARHLASMGSGEQTVQELLRDVRRRDVLGGRLVCWFPSTCKLLAQAVLDRDAIKLQGAGDWIIERLKPVKNKGLIATHIGLFLPQPGGNADEFATFTRHLARLGTKFLGDTWVLARDHQARPRDFDRANEIEFLVELMDGDERIRKPTASSWYRYYMGLTSAEIQIRTALLDTWADQYHDPMYKHGQDADPEVARALTRSAKRLARIETEIQGHYQAIQREQQKNREQPENRE